MTEVNINLSFSRVEQIKEKTRKKWNEQNKKILSQKNNLLSIVLRGHLIVENVMENVLMRYNPNKKYITEKKFGEKIDILRFCQIIDQTIYEKLKTLNNIRNKFAHNIDYKLSNRDIEPLIKGLRPKHKNKLDRVIVGITHLIGYLTFLQEFTKYYPFLYTILQKHNVFQKDKIYKKIRGELKKVIKELNLETWKI